MFRRWEVLREIFCDVDSQFDVVDTLLTLYVDRGMYGLSGLPKVHNDLLGFCVQDQIRCLNATRPSGAPPLCSVSPTMVVSSVNFPVVCIEGWMGVRSLVRRVKRAELSTRPCSAPLWSINVKVRV